MQLDVISHIRHLWFEGTPEQNLGNGPLAGAAEFVVIEVAVVFLVEDFLVRLSTALHKKLPRLFSSVHPTSKRSRGIAIVIQCF